MSGTTPKRNLFAGVFAVLTVGVMALFFNLYEPWQLIGPELIQDGSFSTSSATNDWHGWSKLTWLVPDGGFGGSPGVVLTCSPNQHGVLGFTVYNLTNIPAFRVSLRAAAQGVVQGKEGYCVPRALFLYQDAKDKNPFNRRHVITAILKDTGWRYYKDFFPVPKGAATARFQIQNLGVAGVIQIDDVSVTPVQERPSALWWRLFFGTLWTTAFGLCLFALRPWERRYGFLLMMTLALIMTGIVLPGKFLDDNIEKSIRAAKSLSSKTIAAISHSAQTVKIPAPEQPATSKTPKPKEEPIIVLSGTGVGETHVIGHFTLFSLLAFLSALSWISAPYSLRRALAVSAGLAFFAAATEVLQFIPPDRSAGLSDLRTDTVGMAGAVVLVLLLRGVQRFINRD